MPFLEGLRKLLLFVKGNTTSTWEVSEGVSFSPRFSDVPFIDIYASTLFIISHTNLYYFYSENFKGLIYH